MGLFSGITKIVGSVAKTAIQIPDIVSSGNIIDIGAKAGKDIIENAGEIGGIATSNPVVDGSAVSQLFLRGVVILVGIIFLAGGVFLLGRQND